MDSAGWLMALVIGMVAALAGVFLYGWLRRRDKPPPGVRPLTDEDDARWR